LTQNITVFYREAMPVGEHKGDVLLLHGTSFTSETWQKRVMQPVGFMNILAAAGYRVIAVDLPGWADAARSLVRLTAVADAWHHSESHLEHEVHAATHQGVRTRAACCRVALVVRWVVFR